MKLLWFHLMPYTELFAKKVAAVSGAVQRGSIASAGHLADLDAPDAVADQVLGFLD
jgi:hypothetical protein